MGTVRSTRGGHFPAALACGAAVALGGALAAGRDLAQRACPRSCSQSLPFTACYGARQPWSTPRASLSSQRSLEPVPTDMAAPASLAVPAQTCQPGAAMPGCGASPFRPILATSPGAPLLPSWTEWKPPEMRGTPGIDIGPAPTASTYGNSVSVKSPSRGRGPGKESGLAPPLRPGVRGRWKKSG